MVKKDKVQVQVEVDGRQGINELGKLEMEAKDLRATLKDLKKGTDEYNQANAQLKNATAEIGRLRSEMGLAGMTMRQMTSYQRDLQKEWNNLTKGTEQYARVDAELKKVNATINQQRAELKGTAGVWGFLKSEIGKFGAIAVAALGFDAVIGKINNLISRSAKLSDAIADVQMTTGMSAQAVENYNRALTTLNTRTSREDLLGIGKIAGQFGVAKDEMLAFTTAMNKTSVVLSSEFSGGAEEITEKMATLRNVFSDIKTDNISDDITKISNAVVTLAQEGVATAPVVTDFANRIAGVGINLGLSTAQVLGLSATMQELGITAERGGTAVGKILQKMTTNTNEFAKVAGMDLKSFSNLVNTDIYGAFLKVLEGSKKSGEAATVLGRLIKDLEISGAGASEVFSKLGGNMDLLGERTRLAGKAINETSAITEQYNLKNENFAGNLERVQKWMAAIFMNSSIISGIQTLVGWMSRLTEVNMSDTLRQEQIEMNLLTTAAIDANTEHSTRLALIEELQDKYPSYFGNLNAETATNEELQKALAAVNAEYLKKIFIQEQAEKISEFGKQEIDLQRKLIEQTKELAKAGRNFRVEAGGEVRYFADDIKLSISGTKSAIAELKRERDDFMKGQSELAKMLGIDTSSPVVKKKKVVEDPVVVTTGGGDPEADKEKAKREKANADAFAELQKHIADVDKFLEENDIKRELSSAEKRERELLSLDLHYMGQISKAEEFNAQAQANENLTREQKLQAENEYQQRIFDLNVQWIDAKAAKEEELRLAEEARKEEIRLQIELALMDKDAREIENTRRKYEELIALAEENGFNTIAIYEMMYAEIGLLKEKQNADEVKAEAKKRKQMDAFRKQDLESMQSITNSFGALLEETSASTEEAFNVQKAFKLAEIFVNQAVALANIFASGAKAEAQTPSFGARGASQILAASAAVLPGFIQAIAVMNSKPPQTKGFYYGGETGDENGKFVGKVHANEYVVPSFIRSEPAVVNATGVIEAYRQNAISTGRTTAQSSNANSNTDSTGGGVDMASLVKMMEQTMAIVQQNSMKKVYFVNQDYNDFNEETAKIEFLAQR